MNEISGPNVLDSRSGATTHILTALPPPPTKPHRTTAAPIHKQHSLVSENETHSSNQSQSQPISLIIVPGKNLDSCNSPTEVPTSPRSSRSLSGDKSWSFFHKDGHSSWTNFEEHHHLLGNEEDGRHSSEDDFDIWSINEEQKEYYTNQFKSMQPDLKKKITGASAKEFFEKSKLPLTELSKIWQLSDVDKDGALTLEEFSTAMHLVVLRRNNIELPDVLPLSLVPKISKKVSEADATVIPVVPQVQNAHQAQAVHSPSKHTSPSDVTSPQSKEWTKFNDSPTSSLSSPGMKPVNFDFSAASVEQDPKILHPVALRLSPERQPTSYPAEQEKELISTAEESIKSNHVQATIVQRPIPRKPLGPSLSNASSVQISGESNVEACIHPHSNSFSGMSDATKTNMIPSSSQAAVGLPQGPKKEPPPPPPPRPKHNHIRSSSLDLNKLGKTVPHFLGAPPAVPPRVSPSTGAPRKVSHGDEHLGMDDVDFADFANFDEADSSNLHLKSGAFEIYKKPLLSQDGSSLNSSTGAGVFLLDQTSTPTAVTDDSTALLVDISHPEESDRRYHPAIQPLALTAVNITSVPQTKKDLQSAIQAHRERNMMLSLLNNELNQELSEVMEERIALEVQLEHLKPFS